MDIHIYSNDKTFSCTYNYWHKIRTNIIKATMDYIKDKFTKDKELFISEDINDKNYIGIGSHYNYYMNNMYEIINEINEVNKGNFYYVNMDMQLDNTLRVFMSFVSEFKHLSALNYFGLGGLFALSNQSDSEGYYTPGNSLDICLLLDKIKFYMKKYEGYNCIYKLNMVESNTIYDVFETSRIKLINVVLC